MKSKLIVFGATGGTGKQVLEQAIERGYSATAFVRTPEKVEIKHPNLKVVQGDVLNYKDVVNVIQGHLNVICCLGVSPLNKSKLRTIGTQNIVKSMQEKKVKRFICQASLGYGETKNLQPWHYKYILTPLLLKHTFNDHISQEIIVEKSDLDWTIVRPGNLTNGKRTEEYLHGFPPSFNVRFKISRADVAHFMLNQIEDQQYIGQKVGLSY